MAFAFAVSDYIIFIMLSSIGLRFSALHILFILFPGILKFMPKPYSWMASFKKFLATLLIGAVSVFMACKFSNLI